MQKEAKYSPVSLSISSSARSSQSDQQPDGSKVEKRLKQAQEVLEEMLRKREAEDSRRDASSCSSISSQGSQVDLTNLVSSFKSTRSDIFSKVQTGVIKVHDHEFLQLPRDDLLTTFTTNWPSLSLESKQDICSKVGIHCQNWSKNIDQFDTLNLESVKDSKLQKLAYLAKMYAKLEKCRQTLVRVERAEQIKEGSRKSSRIKPEPLIDSRCLNTCLRRSHPKAARKTRRRCAPRTSTRKQELTSMSRAAGT